MQRKITIRMRLWCLYYKLLKWRTHEVFIGRMKMRGSFPDKIYIGARRYGQSPKNVFHVNLRDLN